jgi:aconitate hydratase
MFRRSYGRLRGRRALARWTAPGGDRFAWEDDSTYVRSRRTSRHAARGAGTVEDIRGARVLAVLGDSVTTDHISPAGSIKKDSPGGPLPDRARRGAADFNSYGSRRGNHEVMVRGTFANVRIRNRLVPGTEGGFTTHLPSGEIMTIYDAAMRYQRRARRWSCSPARSTAPARAATGRPRGRTCRASRR